MMPVATTLTAALTAAVSVLTTSTLSEAGKDLWTTFTASVRHALRGDDRILADLEAGSAGSVGALVAALLDTEGRPQPGLEAPIAALLAGVAEVGGLPVICHELHVHLGPQPVEGRGVDRLWLSPPVSRSFTGRRREQAQLVAGLSRRGSGAAPVMGVVGAAGMGSSALAHVVAEQLRDRYAHGCLYADLAHGRAVARALAELVDALDPGGEPSLELERLAARYRALTTARSYLVLIDGVASADDLSLFVPGAGDSAVLYTARTEVDGLQALGGRLVLDALPPQDAHELLTLISGGATVAARTAAQALATVGHRPAAVCALGAALAGDYETGQRLLRGLATSQPGASDRPEPAATAAVAFHVADALPPAAFRVYLALGGLPAVTVSAAGLAVATGLELEATAEAVESLVQATLVTAAGPDRVRLRPEARLDARDRALANRAVVDDCWWRWAEHLLRRAQAADRVLGIHRARLPAHPFRTCPHAGLTYQFTNEATALAWCLREWPALVGLALDAAARGHGTLLLGLVDALWPLQHRIGPVEMLELARLALFAAREQTNIDVLVRRLLALNQAARFAGEWATALDVALEAARLAHRRDPHRHAGALLDGGKALRGMGLPAPAERLLQQARSIAQDCGDLRRLHLAWHALADLYLAQGRLQAATAAISAAVPLLSKIPTAAYEGPRTLLLDGLINCAAGDLPAALGALDRALADPSLAERAPRLAAALHTTRGHVEEDLGSPDAAIHDYRRALGLHLNRLGDGPDAVDLRERLDRLTTRVGP